MPPLADTLPPLARADSGPRDTAAWTAGIVDTRDPRLGIATLVAVRVASHAGFDRVVFEFAEPSLPGLHVEYVDRPVRACGSGEVVPLAGDAWLEIRFYPANAHDEEGRATLDAREIAPRLPVVLEMKLTCDFEAEVAWVLGVASPERYRVLELSGPARIVVDVRHPRR